jgi:Transposase DNA-binding/Transposase Tn5 dimerisation domain
MSTLSATLESSELWAARVAGQADFPDERLNTRFGLILQTLADKPLDSFPQACRNRGQTQALYRFLENRRLEVADFLQPLTDTTLDACRGRPTVLAIQDSSSANYSTLKQTTGLGKLNDSDALGIHFHSTIAVQPDGVALGLLHQSHWCRPPEAEPVSEQRKNKPIADKESSKWLDGIEAAEAALDNLPAEQRPRLIHIFDREGDVHEVLERISASPHGAVIRVAQLNRSVAGETGSNVANAIAAAPCLGVQNLEVSARHGVKKRKARLELRSVTVTITPNPKEHPNRRPVTWTLVEAKEIDTPAGVEPLHWLLWTTEPAGTVAEILEVLRLYKLRWPIEDFHLTLKSGCRIEKLRLETADRLIKALVTYSAVALRIVALRDLARQRPDAPCTVILTTDQWQALYAYVHDRRPDATTPVPTIRQAVLWIGRLGGHLNRKGDGMPGVRTLWRGWRDLAILVFGYQVGQRKS